jgi:membrane protease YdiL (CAAX protease family)
MAVHSCRSGSRRFATGDLGRDLGLEMSWRDSYRGVGVYWLMGLAAALAVTPFPGSRFQGTNTQVLQHARPHLYDYLVVGLIAVVAAPIFEELLFRGLLLRGLLTRMPTWAAVVV